MRRSLKEQTFHRFAGHDDVGICNILGRFKNNISFGLGVVMASKAIGAQYWQDFILKIHRRCTLNIRYWERSSSGACQKTCGKRGRHIMDSSWIHDFQIVLLLCFFFHLNDFQLQWLGHFNGLVL